MRKQRTIGLVGLLIGIGLIIFSLYSKRQMHGMGDTQTGFWGLAGGIVLVIAGGAMMMCCGHKKKKRR